MEFAARPAPLLSRPPNPLLIEPTLAMFRSRSSSSSSKARNLQGDPYAKFAGIGLQFALTLALFAWGGYWLDGKFDTSPAFLITGVLTGFVGALISMVHRLPSTGRKSKAGASTTNDSSATDSASATDQPDSPQ